MNKTELIAAAAEKAGISKKDAEKAFNAVFECITASVAAGDKVSVPNFGVFEVKERAARVCRNPATGESVEVDACKVPAFRPGKALKDAVNG